MPLGVLDALFIAFVAVQATVLFGGHAHVLETEGLTYAEYARQGFWQLLWVSALTLLVLSWRSSGWRARATARRPPAAAGARRNPVRHIGCRGDLGDPPDVGVPAGLRVQRPSG